jgi:hypothetical protein
MYQYNFDTSSQEIAFFFQIWQNHDDLPILPYFGRKMRKFLKILQILVKIRSLDCSKFFGTCLIIFFCLKLISFKWFPPKAQGQKQMGRFARNNSQVENQPYPCS